MMSHTALAFFVFMCSRVVNANQVQKGHWGSWGSLSSCSATCGEGTMEVIRHWVPGPDEPASNSQLTMTKLWTCTSEMAECPSDGRWGGWAGWSRCSKLCGGGTRRRTRECINKSPEGKDCEGETSAEEDCGKEPCPILPLNFDFSQCREGQNFTCASGKMCVPLRQRCDRTVQCHDGTDEKDCTWLPRPGDVRYDLSRGAGSSFLQNAGVSMFVFCITTAAFLLQL